MFSPDYKDLNHGYWRHRGYLPHLEDPGVVQHITFHLADSLPRQALARLEQQLESFPPDKRDIERRRKLEKWLDAVHGSCPLCDPKVAEQMQDVILHFEGRRYELFAWVVMPNHVHVLLQATPGHEINHIVKSWKSFSGRFIGAYLRDRGDSEAPQRIWHRDYWDRYIRSERHFERVVNYIQQNPVKARLATKPEEWKWCSAHPRFASVEGHVSSKPDGRTERIERKE
jgi:putative transposase